MSTKPNARVKKEAKPKKRARATRDEYKLAGLIVQVLDSDAIEDIARELGSELRDEARGLEYRRKVVLSREVVRAVGRHVCCLVLDALTYMNEDE